MEHKFSYLGKKDIDMTKEELIDLVFKLSKKNGELYRENGMQSIEYMKELCNL